MPDDQTSKPASGPTARLHFVLAILAACISGGILALAFPTWDFSAAIWFWQFPLLWALWGRGGPGLRKRQLFGIGFTAGWVFFMLTLRWLREIHGAGPVLSFVGWTALSSYLALYFGVWAVIAGTVGKIEPSRLLPSVASESAALKGLPLGFGPIGGGMSTLLAPSWHVIGKATLNAAAWVALEWGRGTILGGFGWNGLGVALHENLALIQVAEFVGVSGVAFLPVFVSVCLYATVWRIFRRIAAGNRRFALNVDFAVAMLLVVGCFIFGTFSLFRHRSQHENSELAPTSRTSDTSLHQAVLQVAVVQQNIDQERKWDPTLALDHTQGYLEAFSQAYQQQREHKLQTIDKALREGGSEFVVNFAPPDMVLLPESALPFYLSDPVVEDFRDEIFAITGPTTALVTGIDDGSMGDDAGNPPQYYNTIAVMRAGQAEPLTHKKVKLVPFGEYLPLRWFPPMRWLAGAAVPGDFTAGKITEPLLIETKIDTVGLLPLICFEDTIGRHARRFVRAQQAQILTNATNDGWFKDPAAALQHAANAKFRCIELRRPMVRAANTGLSCVIDARGQILDAIREPASGSPQVAGVMFASIPLNFGGTLTFYARFGDVFSFSCLGIALVGGFFCRKTHF